jgi:cytosine deaminase
MTSAQKFRDLQVPRAERFWLRRARVPLSVLETPPHDGESDAEGSRLVDILVAGPTIADVRPAGSASSDGLPSLDVSGRQVWPALVDMHTHLNKSHSHARSPNLDGSFSGARRAATLDREYSSYEDTRARMTFALRCAYVHGVAAIRTHVDSRPEVADAIWRAFRDVRKEWAGRIELQGVSLLPIELLQDAYGVKLADLVAQSGGILGAVTRPSSGEEDGMLDDAERMIETLFGLAAERDLDIDLHVDESGDVDSVVLPKIAAASLRHSYQGRVVCGHCCSLALQPEGVVRTTLELCAEAGIAVVTLPTSSMYLQDRAAGVTPRWRGVTLIHELRNAGISVAIAGDNCRDYFFPYGDNDMVETLQQAIRVLHLDPALGEAVAMVAPVPAKIMGTGDMGVIGKGKSARLILFNARSINELMSRPHSGRIVLDKGMPIREELPEYSELDALNERVLSEQRIGP